MKSRPLTQLAGRRTGQRGGAEALRCASALLALAVLLTGCEGKVSLTAGDDTNDGGSSRSDGGTSDGQSPLPDAGGDGPDLTDSGAPPSSTPNIPTPDAALPAEEASTNLALSPAPALGAVMHVKNRSSVMLYLPGVAGAHDYRVFAVEQGVSVKVTNNREHIDGATIVCAGLRQRNQCDDGAILPLKYNNAELDLPRCGPNNPERRPHVPAQLMQTVEINGIGPDTVLVVEAIDRLCPFPGLFGSRHQDIVISSGDIGGPTVEAVVNDMPYTLQRWQRTFPVRTEAEIRADYGSMIFNGQAWNMPTLDPSSPSFPESPYVRLAQPAPASDPVVLARSVIKVSPLGNAQLPAGFRAQDYFDDFDDDTDQPVFVRDTDYTSRLVGIPLRVYQTRKWILYDVSNEFSDFFVDRGQLNMVSGDPYQNTMSVQAMYPKRAAKLPTAPDQYLHVTYEVQRNETQRRYENFSLCGSDQAGATYEGEAPRASPLPRPGFMNDEDTAATSPLGWNCLLLVGRGAGYSPVAGGDVRSHSDSSLKVTVVATHPAPTTGARYDNDDLSSYSTAFGPTQDPQWPKTYMRQINAARQPAGVWLDDVLNTWNRARFDVFVRRDRVIIYVDGQQRICQDLPGAPLTMAEAAIGFWHVLYHTSAEFLEIRGPYPSDNPGTGQRHILHNTPFADMRTYDNVGFREDVTLPPGFDAARCYPN